MNGSLLKKVVVVALVAPVLGLLVVNGPLSIGQDKAKKAEKTEPAAKRKGQLPAYYGDVVTEEQRAKIYEIQAKYADQIKDLTAQLEALRDKQSQEIEAVLSAEQKAKVEAAREAAAAKKKKKADDKKKAETKTN
jgi:isopentenyl phosphate kinase